MATLIQLKTRMIIVLIALFIFFTIFFFTIAYVFEISPIYSFLLAAAFIILQFIIGPTLVKISTGLKYLRQGENLWLEDVVTSLCRKGKLPIPKLAIVNDTTPNAFTFGYTSKSATLAIHRGLLEKLNKSEIEAVIGHELGHIRHKDAFIITAISALPLLAYLIARTTFSIQKVSGERRRRGNILPILLLTIISYLIYIIGQLFVYGFSRMREHYADTYSAFLTKNPRALVSALARIAYGLALAPKENASARAFYILDPIYASKEIKEILEKKEDYDINRDGVLDEKELEMAMEREAESSWVRVNMLFSTHPPTYKRILLLKQIEKELETGNFSEKSLYRYI
ncbi:MAG: M48 family metalloprotease [Nitrososphaeria archaeon]|nr:M48 family metalloprotease [Nitrososphaeria archaeon]